jgi:hypothetical protein
VAAEAVGRPEQRARGVQAMRRDDAGDAFAVDRDPDLRARGKGTATARRTITTEAWLRGPTDCRPTQLFRGTAKRIVE